VLAAIKTDDAGTEKYGIVDPVAKVDCIISGGGSLAWSSVKAGGTAYILSASENDFKPVTFSELLGDKACYLSEGLEVDVMYFNGQPVAATLPTKVSVTVAETPGSAKGDTAGNATKVATLAGGAELRVPMFVNAGDKIIVNTETDSYVERA
jgi:elongation factor P